MKINYKCPDIDTVCDITICVHTNTDWINTKSAEIKGKTVIKKKIKKTFLDNSE